MKKIGCLFLIILTVFTLVSCSSSSAKEEEKEEAIVLNASALGNSDWITIDPKKTYSLTNLQDNVMYAIEIQSGTKAASGETKSKDNDGFLTAGDNTVVVPDTDRKRTATGSDFGSKNSNDQMRVYHIDIANPNGDEELSIVAQEADFTAEACTEWNAIEALQAYRGYKKQQFYHVNFNTPKYKDLDRKRVFLVIDSNGGDMGGVNWGLITLGQGYNKNSFEKDVSVYMHMYDFSDVQFVNIYHDVERYFTKDAWDEQTHSMTSTVRLVNPKSLSYTATAGTEIVEGDRIICIPEPENEGKYVITVTGFDLGEVIQLSDSTGRDYGFAYCMDINAKDKSYLIEHLDKEVFFNLKISSRVGNIEIREATANDKVAGQIVLSGPTAEFISDEITISRNYKILIPVEASEGYVPSSLIVRTSVVDQNGDIETLEGFSSTVKSAHTSSTGYSSESKNKNPSVFKVRNSDILKSIMVSLSNRTQKSVKVKVSIEDGSKTILVGKMDTVNEEYEVSTVDYNDLGYFGDIEEDVCQGDIFWYLMDKADYEAEPEKTLGDALDSLSDVISKFGVNTDQSYFYPTNRGTALRLSVSFTARGTADNDSQLVFVYALYNGEEDIPLSSLKPSDLTVLQKETITFVK